MLQNKKLFERNHTRRESDDDDDDDHFQLLLFLPSYHSFISLLQTASPDTYPLSVRELKDGLLESHSAIIASMDKSTRNSMSPPALLPVLTFRFSWDRARSLIRHYIYSEYSPTLHSSYHRSPSLHQTLLEPYTYISANPGKEVRSQLIEAFNLWLEVPEGDLEVIRGVVRMLHNASLLYVSLPHSLSPYYSTRGPFNTSTASNFSIQSLLFKQQIIERGSIPSSPSTPPPSSLQVPLATR